MDKGKAFAIATQQAHALGKSPRGYGTPEGRRTAKQKYRTPSDDTKTAAPRTKEAQWAAFFDELPLAPLGSTKVGSLRQFLSALPLR